MYKGDITFDEAEKYQKEMLKKIIQLEKKNNPTKGHKPTKDDKKRMEDLKKEVKDIYAFSKYNSKYYWKR